MVLNLLSNQSLKIISGIVFLKNGIYLGEGMRL